MRSPTPRAILFICAIKMTDTVRKSAVPSILMVPIGRMNLVILLSTLTFSSINRKVMGIAADLHKGKRGKSVDCISNYRTHECFNASV